MSRISNAEIGKLIQQLDAAVTQNVCIQEKFLFDIYLY